METDFDKNAQLTWCEGCSQQGYVFVDDPFLPHFVVCKQCGHETSEVWCPHCEMGGNFVRGIEGSPKSWTCPDCNTVYLLPVDFYKEPTTLYQEDDLPQEVLARIAPPANRQLETLKALGLLAIIIGFGICAALGTHQERLAISIVLLIVVGVILLIRLQPPKQTKHTDAIALSSFLSSRILPDAVRNRLDMIVFAIAVGGSLLVGGMVVLVFPVWGSLIVILIIGLSLAISMARQTKSRNKHS